MKCFKYGMLWLCLLTAPLTYGADWKIYSTDMMGNKNYYDLSTIKYIDFGKAEGWIKEERGSIFGISNVRADCDKDDYIYLQSNTFETKTKRLLKQNTSGFVNIKPHPESVGYSALRVICESALSEEVQRQVSLPKRKDYTNDTDHIIAVFKGFGLNYENRTQSQTDEFNKGMADVKQKQVVYKSSLKLLKLIKKLKWMQESGI